MTEAGDRELLGAHAAPDAICRLVHDDVESRALRRNRRRGGYFAIREIAGQHVAQRGAAARARYHLVDLDAGLIEIALFDGDGPGQRGGDPSVLADGELISLR